MKGFYVVFFIMILSFLSCDYFSKKNENNKVNTVVDYSKVDMSPSFEKCEGLSIKAKKTCFRAEIKKRITADLRNYSFTSKELINEIVLIDLLISNKGIFKLKKINSSSKIKKTLPKLDSILRRVITKLPKVTPAKKRGIPVAIQYQLPITIKIKEELN